MRRLRLNLRSANLLRIVELVFLLAALPGRSWAISMPTGMLFAQDSGDKVRAAFERAQQALMAQDYAGAERGFKEFLKLDPNSAAAYTNLGVVYMRTGKLEEA